MFTRFFDMCSGGSEKTSFEVIYIEGNEAEATELFKLHFGRDPNNVTCECCGPDFSISERPSLEAAREYDDEHGSRSTVIHK